MARFIERLSRHPELFILLLIIVVVTMLVIPLPTALVDFLIGLNIVLSALVFLSSFYIDRILDFSTFPAVLLITTLFRLALSVSTSRLILTHADAGEIIATFGQFVMGDNLVVGFVIFAIVTLVQFMVITKGAERVAEVAARFSLDGMPGKQMSIDADVRAGSLDTEAARQRRSVLERESQLYGSFDGAMKFIKGDAIAGIVIIFINFLGGIGVGMSQHDMDVDQALSTYTMLTIGDGLVAQIPALLIAIGAGFIVTRVNGDSDNMGRTMMAQLLGNPVVLILATLIALGIGSMPGFPFFTFLLLALIPAGLAGARFWRRAAAAPPRRGPQQQGEAKVSPALIEGQTLVEILPLMLVLPASSQSIISAESLTRELQRQFFFSYGIGLPDILIQYAPQADPHSVTVFINEIQADTFQVHFAGLRVLSDPAELESLKVPLIPLQGTLWVDTQQQTVLQAIGCQLSSATDEICQAASAIMLRHISEYFGVQETKNMLDSMEKKYPDLMKEVLRHATVQRVAEVLQRLLAERIPVRNLRLIMEALAQWAPREKEVIALVEHVRAALARYICHRFTCGNRLNVIMLTQEYEEEIRRGVRNTAAGAFLNLEPAEAENLLDRMASGLESSHLKDNQRVVLASVDIRRFLKKFLESRFKSLDVISFAELAEGVEINVIKTI